MAAKRINEADLVEWLRSFGERLLASATPNDELATRMVRLGELSIGEISVVADDIGRRLREKETNRKGAFTKCLEEKDTKKGEEEEAEAWFYQGNEQYMAGDFAGAIASYDRAIEIKPDYDSAWINRGVALDNLGRYEEAIASYDSAIEIKSDLHAAWINRFSFTNCCNKNNQKQWLWLKLPNGYEMSQMQNLQNGMQCKSLNYPKMKVLFVLFYKIS
ncbi:MAG: tetratricopeptide repeat protein [Nostoc sp.]